jgi:predicted dehydrogenase
VSSGSAPRRARLALIGAGAMVQSYVSACAASLRAELVAIADVDIARARKVAAQLRIPALASHGETLAIVPCDGVIISTPPKYHVEVAIDALRAGAHVLCGTPFAIGTLAARRMFAAADRSERVLTMTSPFRFVADVVRAKQMIENGLIGRLLRIRHIVKAPVDVTTRRNSRIQVSGEGALIDNGTHSVDIMRFIMGPITAAYAVDASVDERYVNCEDTAILFVRNAAGVVGTIHLSWVVGRGVPWHLWISGSEGTIRVGLRSSRLHRFGEDPVVFGSGYDEQAVFAAQLEHFADVILGAGKPAIARDDAIASVEVIEAAYDSLRRNAWSAVAPRPPEAPLASRAARQCRS